MVAITGINSASPVIPPALGRARVDQARREAEQAELKAQNLRSQADAAELDAKKSQAHARDVSLQNRPNNPTYPPQSTNQAPAMEPKTQDFLIRMYVATASKFAKSGNPLKTNPNEAPTINTQGQTTGRILNIKT